MKRIFAIAVTATFILGCSGGTTDRPETKGTSKAALPKQKQAQANSTKKSASSKKLPDAETKRLSQLFAQLDSKDSEQRNETMDKLDGEKSLGLKLPALLDSNDAAVRRGALYYLIARTDTEDKEIFEAIVARLTDQDSTVRGRAVQLIREFRDAWVAPRMVEVARLLDSTVESDAKNRAKVARLLGSKRQLAEPALAALAKASEVDPNWRVRSACLVAVHQVGENSEKPSILPILVKSMKSDKDRRVRRTAIARLRQLGRLARPVAKDVVGALGDPEETVRGAAISALVAIGKRSVPPLIEQLKTDDVTRRKWTILALGMLGPRARVAKGPLQKLLKSTEDREVRKLVTAALKEIQ